MTRPMTILFAGGGTGGHLFPGIAVADELRRRHETLRMVFAGSDRAIETSIAEQNRLDHRTLTVESLATLKTNPWRFVARNWQAWRSAAKLIRELQPLAVVGLGGFASAPLIYEAHRRRIPIVLLEQNVIPGKATRWFSRWADRVCVSFEATIASLPKSTKTIVTGNPVRDEIAVLFERPWDEKLSFHSKPELLILGGSHGADSLNEAVIAVMGHLRSLFSTWRISHQTGPRSIDQCREAYQQLGLTVQVAPFFGDLATRLAAARLVISRAGATTLAELACAGTPSILLPFPDAADNHQRANAQVFVDHHAAIMVEHERSPGKTIKPLQAVVEQLAQDDRTLREMGLAARRLAVPDAAARIANIISEKLNCTVDDDFNRRNGHDD